MVTSNNYKTDNGEDLPNFSDPEDFSDDLTDNGTKSNFTSLNRALFFLLLYFP